MPGAAGATALDRALAPRELPAWLSCLPGKLQCYARDPAFLRGWRTVLELEREGLMAPAQLWNLGSVLFKPDSLIRGNTGHGMHALAGAGFQLRAGRSVQFSTPLVRRLWRYALGRYSDQRVLLLARLMSLAPALYLLVAAEQPDTRCPTALRLTDFKGEVVPGLRAEGTLRAVLGAPQTAMFNYVHTADEPADVVRELGLLFAAPARRALLCDALAGRTAQAVSLGAQMLAHTPHADLEFASALGNVAAAVRAALAARDERSAAEDLLARMAQGDDQAWPALRERLDRCAVPVAPLDRLILDCQTVVLKRRQPTQPFPSCELRHWLAAGITAPPVG